MNPIRAICHFLQEMWYFLLLHIYGFLFGFNELTKKHIVLEATKLSKKGQLAVVTGGGRGIGSEVVKKLLQADMDVIIGLRTLKTGHDLLNKFRSQGVTTGTLEVFPLDLLSLSSVREFAQLVLDKKRPIGTLVNNAGIMFTPYTVTADGFESHFQVNYLSHFLLTDLLMPRLKAAGTPENPSRVVNVSSSAHYGAWSLDFNELHFMPKEQYNPYKAYAVTKCLQVVSTRYWNAKLKDENVPVILTSLHPGIIATELYNQLLYARMMTFLLRMLFMSAEQGSDTIAFAAISPELDKQGGLFLANCQPVDPNPLSGDLAIQKKLWDLSVKLIEVKK